MEMQTIVLIVLAVIMVFVAIGIWVSPANDVINAIFSIVKINQ